MNRHPSPEVPPQKIQLVYSRLQNEPRCENRNVAFLLDLQQIALFSLFGASKNWCYRGATGYNLGATVAPIPPAKDVSMPRKTGPDGRRQLRIGTRTDNRHFSSQFTQSQLISDLSPITEFSRD